MSQIASVVQRLTALAITVVSISALPTGACASDRIVLKISPATSAVDQEIHISVAGLQPREKITVVAEQQRFGFPVRSTASFLINETGLLDLSADAPISGDYAGVDPMGLFWSMSLTGAPHLDTSQAPEIAPFDVTVKVYHDGTLLARSTIHRYVVAPTTTH